MPLVGGGGAGNTAGSNPAGTGQGLNYLGDHAFANSGFFTAEDTENGLDVLTFTTGSSYLVGQLTFNGYASGPNPTYGTDGTCEVKFDDQIIATLKNGTGAEVMPTNTSINVIIPPYTKVNVRIEADGSNDLVGATVMITGRVYA